MDLNYLAIIVAGLVPMALGFLWYSVLFEKQWMDSLGFSRKDVEGGNMAAIFGISILMAMILAYGIKIFIELSHGYFDDATNTFISKSDHNFGHGAFHGFFLGILLGIPALVSNSLFQRNTGKNILINVAYWLLTFSVMGGVLDAWI